MVALNETISEPGLGRVARGRRVTASCPQSGSGEPSGIPVAVGINNLHQGMALDPLRGRAKITSRFLAGSFGRWLRCSLLPDPLAGYARRSRLASGQNSCTLKDEFILARSLTGLYYERARWYSPSLGTWISQDPAGYVNGADTYQFVMNDPVGMVDASGLE